MKKSSIKKLVAVVLALTIVLCFAGCAKINYVTNGTIKAIKEVKDGSWEKGGANAEAQAQGGEGATAEGESVQIDEFKADTYGGVEFKTVEDVVKYYVAAYDKTKAKTATYSTPDGTATWYDFLGEENLNVGDIKVEGKSNSIINNLVPGIVGGMFKPAPQPLPPADTRDPAADTFKTSSLTVDDVLAANVKDNGDGTITIQIQPKAVNMSAKGADAQGRFFNTLGDIGPTVESIGVLTWASGTTEENCLVQYENGVGTITIDTASGEIVKADYHMLANVKVQHANVAVIKDKSAELTITYDLKFPVSAEWMKEKIDTTKN